MIERLFKKNYHIQNILFDIMWVLFLSCRIFDNSAWGALHYLEFFNFFRILKYVLAALCVAVILLHFIRREYSYKAVIGYILLGVILLLTARFSDNHTFIWYYLMFAAAWRQDAERVMFLSACVIGIMLIFVVGTALAGIGIDYIFDAGTRGRHGLGFGWTTTGPVLYMFFVFQYLFLRRENTKWFEYLILEAAAVFFFLMTDTNLTFAFTTAILIFSLVEGKIRNRWGFWSRLKGLWLVLPLLICLAALTMYLVYDRNSGIWQQINSAMHGRLTLGQNGIREYGVSLFGQPIEWHGYYITALEVPDYNFIDCSYLYLLLEFGILFLIAVLAIYTFAMYRAVRANDYYLVFLLAAVLLFSVMEPRLMELIYNAFPLMAFLAIRQRPAIIRSSPQEG